MGTLGVKAGVKAEIAFGILSTDLASVGANVEFGAYVKLYGYFIYYFEDLRPANTSLSQETEEMMGALYVDFGLYVTVKFKAQVFLNLIKYEPTLYDGEFPLLTAGVRQSVYDFALEPDEEDILYVWDDDANSTNGISMSLPEIYRTMKRIDLVTGEKSQAAYDKDNFIVVFNDERFSCSGGNIIVDVPENTRYMTAEARIIWKNDKLTFSKYDTDITVPVVWTNMSQSELNEKFTASVAVGNEKDGYTKVWSGRYGRLDVFDLPTEEEILELIDYDSYNLEDGTNLKYESVGGYREETTGQSLARDKTWYFDVEPKQYTVTVKNIQNADGTTTEKIFTANYGESFDFSDLKNTGANNPETMQFSTFRGLTDQETDGEPVTSITVDMAFAEKYGSNAVLYAHYIDDTLTATFEFSGLGMSIEPMKVKFQRGTVPYPGDILGYIYEMTGDESGITYDITPELTSSVASVTYTVNCRLSWEPPKKVTFFNNGAWFHEQLYRAGMTIFKPTAPVRTGYTFVGWRDSSGITYTGDTLGVMGDQNMTFFAIYNANDYYVYYDTQDVNIPNPEPMKLKYDERYDYYYDGNYSLPVLSSEDRVFLGWFTEPEGGTAFKPNMNTLFTGTENMTVYAHWKPFVEVTGDWITNTTPTYTYTGKAQAFTFTVQDPTGNTSALTPENFTVTYLAQTDGAEWTTEPPVNAGAYAVKLELNDNEYYKQTEEIYFEVGVVINKADPEPQSNLFYVTNWVVSPRWSTPSDGKITFKLYKGSINNWSEIGTYTDSPFTIPENQRDNGTYGLQVSVAESQNYTAGESNIYPMDVDGDTGNSTARPPRNAAVNTMTSPAFYSVFPVSLTEKVTKDVMTLSASAKHDTGAVALTNVNASGNPAMTLSPEEIVLNRGKEFEVTLGLDQATDVWGILAAVNYDTDTLELLGYTCGDIFTEAQFTAQNDRTAAPYKLLATLDEIGTTSADGSFVTLKFKVKEDAAEKATFISLETLEVVGENTSIPVDKGDETRMAVDETAPVIEGIVDGETYCPDQTFTVSETNLVSVTVNGEVQTAVDGKYTVAAGDDEQCIVVVTDKAGNCTTYTVTVEHTYGDSWVTDELSHWHECECGDKMDVAEHEFVWVVTKEAEVGVAGEKHEECKVCGYEKAPVEIPALVDGGNSPSTGDSNNILLWVALLFVSGGVLIIPIFVSVRKVRRKL